MWVSRSRLEKSLVIPLAMWPVKAGGTKRALARRQTPPLSLLHPISTKRSPYLKPRSLSVSGINTYRCIHFMFQFSYFNFIIGATASAQEVIEPLYKAESNVADQPVRSVAVWVRHSVGQLSCGCRSECEFECRFPLQAHKLQEMLTIQRLSINGPL